MQTIILPVLFNPNSEGLNSERKILKSERKKDIIIRTHIDSSFYNWNGHPVQTCYYYYYRNFWANFPYQYFLKKFIENSVVKNKPADLLLLLLLILLLLLLLLLLLFLFSSGLVIFHTRHKNAKGPFHMVHSENWLVYCLYNTKSRRYELTVLELYDGYTERNRYNFGDILT